MRRASTHEATITKQIVAYINSLPGAIARKRHAAGMGMIGDPDIDACIHGRSVQIEVKRPGCSPTPLQMRRIAEWSRAGALAFVATSLDDVKSVLAAAHLGSSDEI